LHRERNLCSETRFLYPRDYPRAGARNRVSGIAFAWGAKSLLRNPVSLSPRRRQKPGFWNSLCILTTIFVQKPGFLMVSLSPRRRQKPGFWNNLCILPEMFVQKPGFFIPAPKVETGFLE
jgi:hypothetical protein